MFLEIRHARPCAIQESPGGLGCLLFRLGGEWQNDLWRALCVERRLKLEFQEVGAQPWISERRNGLARGIYNRLQANRYYTGSQILTEAQWFLNTVVSASGYSAFSIGFWIQSCGSLRAG